MEKERRSKNVEAGKKIKTILKEESKKAK